MAEYVFIASLGIDGAEKNEILEIDDEVLDRLSEEGRQEYLENYLEQWACDHIKLRWEEKAS